MMGAADESYYRCKVCGHKWATRDRIMWHGLGYISSIYHGIRGNAFRYKAYDDGHSLIA